jgi:hypothetical protein
MSGLLLRTGRLREYNALGSVGRPVYTAAPQLRALVKRLLGQDSADMLAVPQINEAGDTVDWYGPAGGMVVPWSTASEEERAPARQALQQARESFHRRSAEMLSQGSTNQDMEVFARLLPFAIQIPDESHIHLVNGRPVLTFWGFTRLNAPPNTDVIRDLGLRPMMAATPVHQATPEPTAPLPAQPWWRRLWWLLLLLLLLPLLFLLFGLRSCGVDVPVPGLGGAAPNISMPSVDAPAVAVPQVGVPPVGVPQLGVPQGGIPNAALPNGGAVAPQGAAPGAPNIPAPGDAASAPSPAMQPPAPNPPALGKDAPGAPPSKADLAPPALTLPEQAMKDGSTDFLNGHWRSWTGLMDSQTGRPLEVEYDFKDGKGTATILRSDGIRCPAPAEAAIKGGKLMLDQTADARCSDGQVFDRSRVECRQGKNGKADCQGVHADGGGYFVEIVK